MVMALGQVPPIRNYLSINVRKRREQSIQSVQSRQLTVLRYVYYLYNNRTFFYICTKIESFQIRKLNEKNTTWKNSPQGVNR